MIRPRRVFLALAAVGLGGSATALLPETADTPTPEPTERLAMVDVEDDLPPPVPPAPVVRVGGHLNNLEVSDDGVLTLSGLPERDGSPADVPISAGYLHLGATRADRIAEFNEDINSPPPGDISVQFSRFRNLHTVEEPDVLPILGIGLFSVDFHDHREDSGGVYRDVDSAEGADELKFLTEEGSEWLIYGNQVTHDIPLAGYSIGPEHIVAPTVGGDIFVSIGPWGAHVGPHTGHLVGNHGRADARAVDHDADVGTALGHGLGDGPGEHRVINSFI